MLDLAPVPAEANFEYAPAGGEGAGLPLAVSIFADRPHLRQQLRDDVEMAGCRIGQAAEVASLLEGAARPLGEVVLLDCPAVTGAVLAALARLDLRAANSGAQLVVSTSLDALDDVFGCMDQSGPQILVDPTRAERMIALGRVLAKVPGLKVRELSQEDRLMLLRLTEQVSRIAERMDRLGDGSWGRNPKEGGAQVESPAVTFNGLDEANDSSLRTVRPAWPDPALVRRMIRQRQLRARFFDGGMFSDPAWDILLDLTAARGEKARVSVTSLCIASGAPATTALRWIGQMVEAGLLARIGDEADRRRAFITLTDTAADGMARYFAELDCV